MADLERLARWAERFFADAVLSAPVLLDWEMISRVQQYNNAHVQRATITLFGQTLTIAAGNGYNGLDSSGNKVPLALPSPIQLLQAYLAGQNMNTGNNELLMITITPTSITLGTTFNLVLTASNPGAGPFVLADEFNTALLLPPVLIGSNTVTASPSVFGAGSQVLHVKDQATGVSSNGVPLTFS